MTILSRVQRYDFRRIPTSAIIGRIGNILAEEGISAEQSALAIIGREAEGSMRDALSIMDQILAAGTDNITAGKVAELLGVVSRKVYYDISRAIIKKEPFACLKIIKEVDRDGFDMTTFSKGLVEHLRDLVVAGVCQENASVLDLPEDEIADLISIASMVSNDTLHRMFKHVSEAYDEIARSPFPKILLETTLARLADMDDLIPAAQIVKRLEALARMGHTGAAGGQTPNAGPAATPSSGAGGGSLPKPPSEKQMTGSDMQNAKPDSADSNRLKGSLKSESAFQNERRKTASVSAKLPVERPFTDADWKKLLNYMSAKMPAKASVIERAVPSQNSTNLKLTLMFDVSDAFSASRVNDKEVLQAVKEALKIQTGHNVQLNIEIASLGTRSTLARERLAIQEKTRQLEENARNHPVIKRLEAALGGKISKIQIDNNF
jgi:DNA polymerase III gamma/tau subunit